jgi:hypothetical protein
VSEAGTSEGIDEGIRRRPSFNERQQEEWPTIVRKSSTLAVIILCDFTGDMVFSSFTFCSRYLMSILLTKNKTKNTSLLKKLQATRWFFF